MRAVFERVAVAAPPLRLLALESAAPDSQALRLSLRRLAQVADVLYVLRADVLLLP